MSTLTTDEARAIANQFDEAARQITEFRNTNNGLSPDEKRELSKKRAELLKHAVDLTAISAQIMFDDLATSLQKVKDSSAKAIAAMKTIEDVSKYINYATLMVTLGGAIMTGNAVAIASASAEILKEVNKG